MKATNFSVSRSEFIQGMQIEVNNHVFQINEILPTEKGKGKQYLGVLTFPNGEKKVYDKPVFVTQLNKIAGAKMERVTQLQPKGESNKVIGTTKKITTNGIKLATFNDMFEKACNYVAEINEMKNKIALFELLIMHVDAPNDTLKYVKYLQEEQTKKINEIRNKERTKKIFAQRYELAKVHLEKLEKELLKNVMLDKFENVPTLKAKIKEQAEHVERMKEQAEKF